MKDATIHIRISRENLMLLNAIAKKEYRTKSAIVNKAIGNYLIAKQVLTNEKSTK